jgi:hypothetical protein
MRDHNPWLAPETAALLGSKGGERTVERPDAVENIAWQTRAAAPTASENALADALQAIFADEIYDLPGIVARLNQAGLRAPGSGDWTAAGFEAEMARLGA